MLQDIKVADTITGYLALGPKHPVREQFNELQILPEVDSLLHSLKDDQVPHEKKDEVNALALWYGKRMKQKEDPLLKKVKAT